jgi:hypothetical protein
VFPTVVQCSPRWFSVPHGRGGELAVGLNVKNDASVDYRTLQCSGTGRLWPLAVCGSFLDAPTPFQCRKATFHRSVIPADLHPKVIPSRCRISRPDFFARPLAACCSQVNPQRVRIVHKTTDSLTKLCDNPGV